VPANRQMQIVFGADIGYVPVSGGVANLLDLFVVDSGVLVPLVNYATSSIGLPAPAPGGEAARGSQTLRARARGHGISKPRMPAGRPLFHVGS
jgi:hypothetical protein